MNTSAVVVAKRRTIRDTAHMTRNEKLLEGLALGTASGIEVGALDKPIVPPTTPHIFYVDHAETAALRVKYKDNPWVNLPDLVEVGGIWGDQALAEAAASVAPVDFMIASHVIEHVPDLITWLQEIAAVLKPTGDLRLAIPDRRYSFDILRVETVIADILNAHLVRARVPQPRQIIDHILNVAIVDCERAWAGTLDLESLVKYHKSEEAVSCALDALNNGVYHDVHCWVFTPLSFTSLMQHLVELNYHSFKCKSFFDTERNSVEFFVTLQPCADKAEVVESWRALRALIETAEAQKREDARLQAVANEFAQRDKHIVELERHSEALKQTVVEIRQSTSWRLTAPLRAITSLFRQH